MHNLIGYKIHLQYLDRIPLKVLLLDILKIPFSKPLTLYRFIVVPTNQFISFLFNNNIKDKFIYLSIQLVAKEIDIIKQKYNISGVNNISIGKKFRIIHLNRKNIFEQMNNNKVLEFWAVDEIDFRLSSRRNYVKVYKLTSSWDKFYKELLEQYKQDGYEYYDTTIKVSPEDFIIKQQIIIKDNEIADIDIPTYISHLYRTHLTNTVYYFDSIDFTFKPGTKYIKPIQIGYFLDKYMTFTDLSYKIIEEKDIHRQFEKIKKIKYAIIINESHEVSKVLLNNNGHDIIRIYTPDNIENTKQRLINTINRINSIQHLQRIHIPKGTAFYEVFDIGIKYRFDTNDSYDRQFINLCYRFTPHKSDPDIYLVEIIGDTILLKA